MRKAADAIAEASKPIPMERAAAREQIWTPDKGEDAGRDRPRTPSRSPASSGPRAPSASAHRHQHWRRPPTPDTVAPRIEVPPAGCTTPSSPTPAPTRRSSSLGSARALEAAGKDVWVDLDDIPPASRWREALQEGVLDSGAFVYVISPGGDRLGALPDRARARGASATSGSSRSPTSRSPTRRSRPRSRASTGSRRTGAFEDDFERSVGRLIEAIETDQDSGSRHTRWQERAEGWAELDRDRSLLARGSELPRRRPGSTAQTGREPAADGCPGRMGVGEPQDIVAAPGPGPRGCAGRAAGHRGARRAGAGAAKRGGRAARHGPGRRSSPPTRSRTSRSTRAQPDPGAGGGAHRSQRTHRARARAGAARLAGCGCGSIPRARRRWEPWCRPPTAGWRRPPATTA